MALKLTVRSSFVCHSCRAALLRSSSLSADIRPSPWLHVRTALTGSSTPALRPWTAASRKLAGFHSARSVRNEQTVEPGYDVLEAIEPDTRSQPGHLSREEGSDLPWYLQPELQGDSERDRPTALADRQRLPDLPELPPPLLQTLLEHISVDLGLDDLSLLDLRALDPPSALGSNLIMVIGTARSEKHLHVSADRFCRYLRSTHDLRAHADGLLGRGELKIRMRRMAKRSRLLANVGAVDTRRSVDDMRTGWVCVMVDGIEPHPEWKPPPKKSDFVGFDERSDNISMVVQMFTEEKREEIDLERLWTGRFGRATNPLPDEENTLDLQDEEGKSERTEAHGV